MACISFEEEDTKVGLNLQCSEIIITTGMLSEEEDSKVGLHLLTQQITPMMDMVEPLPFPMEIKLRHQSLSAQNDFNGFLNSKSVQKRSRSTWRHFCALLNGIQQVLKHRFKKPRRVFDKHTNKAEIIKDPQEQQVIFPRQLPPAQRRTKRPPKVPRPPTRVQPHRKRAMRQRYVFK